MDLDDDELMATKKLNGVSGKLSLENYLKQRIESVKQCYEKELPILDLGEGHKVINISGLSKNERDEILNKRNCLLVQKHCYEEILRRIKNEDENTNC